MNHEALIEYLTMRARELKPGEELRVDTETMEITVVPVNTPKPEGHQYLTIKHRPAGQA